MTARHRFHPSILREYDIRGVVGETLSVEDARAVGRAFATVIKWRGGRSVCVGRDGRLSSPEMEAALIEGLVSAGAQVRRVGLGPTPMLYFATVESGADGGVMVTGSHNPPHHNGFKMMAGGKPFFGADIKDLGRLAAAGEFAEGAGHVTETPVFDAYVERLARDYDGERAVTAVWDAGNGAAGEAMTAVTGRLPGRHVLLNETIDGTFPAHHPDPTVAANLKQLVAAVKAEGAEVGIAFDGDGDRIGVVDGEGRILWGDQLMILLAEDVLRAHPGAPVIADVKASQALFDEVARLGGRPEMWRTGHSLIKSRMAETGAPLAGEMSGHIFFADRYYGFDDALYAAVRLLGIIGRYAPGETLATRADRLPRLVNTPEIRFPCDDERKFQVIEEVKARLAAQGADFSDVDGVRVRTPDGWWLLRASNTQAVLVARCEAADEAGLSRLQRDLCAHLSLFGLTLPTE